MCGAPELGLSVQQSAAVIGREEPFVWVDNEAVGALYSVEEMARARCGKSRATVRAVDMQPHPEPLTNVRYTGEVVDDAGIRGTGRSDHSEDVMGVDED